MKDRVFIEQLEFEAIIGIYDSERHRKQPLTLSLEMAVDASKAALSQDLNDTLDYSAIAQRVEDFIVEKRFQLLETLAEDVALMIHQEFGVNWLKLTVGKPLAVSKALNVGLTIERSWSSI